MAFVWLISCIIKVCSEWRQMWVSGQWPKCFNQTPKREFNHNNTYYTYWPHSHIKQTRARSFLNSDSSSRQSWNTSRPSWLCSQVVSALSLSLSLSFVFWRRMNTSENDASDYQMLPYWHRWQQLHDRRQLRSRWQQSSSVLHSRWTQVPWHGSRVQTQSCKCHSSIAFDVWLSLTLSFSWTTSKSGGAFGTSSHTTPNACTCSLGCWTMLVFLVIIVTWMALECIHSLGSIEATRTCSSSTTGRRGRVRGITLDSPPQIWQVVTGVQSLWNETEIKEIAYANHKHATKDLYDSIAAGQFPKWKLSVQIMDPAISDMVSVLLSDDLTWPVLTWS